MNTIICPNCHQPTRAWAKTCEHCGAELAGMDSEVQPAVPEPGPDEASRSLEQAAATAAESTGHLEEHAEQLGEVAGPAAEEVPAGQPEEHAGEREGPRVYEAPVPPGGVETPTPSGGEEPRAEVAPDREEPQEIPPPEPTPGEGIAQPAVPAAPTWTPPPPGPTPVAPPVLPGWPTPAPTGQATLGSWPTGTPPPPGAGGVIPPSEAAPNTMASISFYTGIASAVLGLGSCIPAVGLPCVCILPIAGVIAAILGFIAQGDINHLGAGTARDREHARWGIIAGLGTLVIVGIGLIVNLVLLFTINRMPG